MIERPLSEFLIGDNLITFPEYMIYRAKLQKSLERTTFDGEKSVIRLEKVDDAHYTQYIKEAQERLDYFSNMTLEEAQAEVDEDYEYTLQQYYKNLERNNKMKKSLKRLLKEAKAWKPTLEEHKEMKKDAISAITAELTIIDMHTREKPEKKSPQDFLEENIQFAKETIDFWTRQWEKERAKIDEVNKWIIAFAGSLELPIKG